MSGYFVLPGLLDVPFTYRVRTVRDGGGYCTRAVDVTQDVSEGICFTSICSFKKPDPPSPSTASSHQLPYHLQTRFTSALASKPPAAHPPAPAADTPHFERLYRAGHSTQIEPFPGLDIRKVDMAPYNHDKEPADFTQLNFYRALGTIPRDEPNLHACAHLYASDRNSMFTVTNALGMGDRFTQMASLSHTVVLHEIGESMLVDTGTPTGRKKEDGQGVKGERWFCQEARSVRSGDGRGLHESRIWGPDGCLIASTIQDGMLRFWGKEKRAVL